MARVSSGEPAGDVEDWADENKARRARSRARDLGGPADATRRTLDTASAAAAKTDRDEEHERKRPSTHFGSGCRVRSAASRYSSRGRKMKRASGWLRRGGLSWHGVRPAGDNREPPELASTASFRLGVLCLFPMSECLRMTTRCSPFQFNFVEQTSVSRRRREKPESDMMRVRIRAGPGGGAVKNGPVRGPVARSRLFIG